MAITFHYFRFYDKISLMNTSSLFKRIKKIIKIKLSCSIPNLRYLMKQNAHLPHAIGITIHKRAKIGKNCAIFQNVTIGAGKYNPVHDSHVPEIGNNVTLYANSIIIGGIKIGDNAIIGAGSVVLNDVPPNTTVAGNPAKIIK